MIPLRLTLPLPPTLNHSRYQNHHRNATAQQWRFAAWVLVTDAVNRRRWRMVRKGTKAHLILRWYWPDARRRDPNNYHKELFDALQDAGVFEDDQWAVIDGEDFEVDRRKPRVEVMVNA